MATVTIVGTVTCKEGEDPCTVRQFDSGNSIVSFSVLDKQYVYTKKGEERFGQFYKCEIMGKAGQIAVDRLRRGDCGAGNARMGWSGGCRHPYGTVGDSRDGHDLLSAHGAIGVPVFAEAGS